MIKLQCSKCGKTRMLDSEDEDEVQNACIEGWDFALTLDLKTLCPLCKLNKDLNEPDFSL